MPNSSAWLPSRSAWFTNMFRPVQLASFLFAVGWSWCVGAEVSNVELGQSIFEKGIGRDGREIGGRIHGTLDLRGAAVACASCHGADGHGRGEAFVQAPDIRWHTLSRSFAPRRIGGARPAYNRLTFGHAVHRGIASNGTSLDPAMPRFDLSEDETEALVSYLARLGEGVIAEEVPTKVVVGLLPSTQQTKFSRELEDRLSSCPSIGAAARFPPFKIIHYTDPDDALLQVKAQISDGRVSAVLAPYIAGWERQYINAATEWPVVTALPVTPLDLPENPRIAFAMPGLTSQVGALLDRALGDRARAVTVLTTASGLPASEIVDFVRNELKMRRVHFNEAHLDQSSTIRPNTPWLLLAPLTEVEKRLHLFRPAVGQKVFVPAMFFDPDAAQRIGRRVKGIIWQIAYPYQPIDTRTGRWRSPTEAWSEAGCILMAAMAEQDGEDWIARHTSISLNSGMTLTKMQDIVQQRKQVVVQKWDSPKLSK